MIFKKTKFYYHPSAIIAKHKSTINISTSFLAYFSYKQLLLTYCLAIILLLAFNYTLQLSYNFYAILAIELFVAQTILSVLTLYKCFPVNEQEVIHVKRGTHFIQSQWIPAFAEITNKCSIILFQYHVNLFFLRFITFLVFLFLVV